MSNIAIKNQLDPLLKQLSTERSFDVAEKIIAELSALLGIKNSERFLTNIARIDAEISRFQLAPGFARQAAAYELPHDNSKPFDLKLFWLKKTSKTNLSWIIGLTPNFEDADSNDYKNIGIDFVVSEACDSVIILLSNKFKVRALELKDHVTPTQLEIFSTWQNISSIEIADPLELKKTLHAKLWESFNFEPVNRKFYLELVEHFSVLVHHLEKALGRKPTVMFTTRLIGRLLFIWFLQKKNLINKSANYFVVADPEKQTEYYKEKLEKLFFEVLNKDELERSNGDHLTPYLNGGLFDKSTTDFYNDPKLTIPNGYFSQLFATLNKYNFTVDESSPEFQHVAIDPEMLGRIFESLLAEQIDENTGNSKKKATGAFYTPREIVSYMCEQSLIEYLKTKIPEAIDRDRRIEELVRMPEAVFRDQDQNKRRDWKPYRDAIITALDGTKTESALTVLDPSVGSGAFPMGMLHLLVKVYSRLNPKFEKDISGLKRNILSRSLYGVDIEQTAIEITRLRAWLSIVVDIPEGEKVEPLPNLEFKFVCANTLIPLDNTEQATFFTDHNLKDKLITIRDDYFKTSSKAKKEKLQKDYLKLTQSASLFDNKKTQQLKSYKPFDISSSSEFYDPELMHGVEAFDIVIGNPPYVQIQKFARTQIQKDLENIGYKTFEKTGDLYALFYERGLELTKKETGLLCYITSNKWMRAKYGKSLRKYFVAKNPKILIDLGGQVFESATVDTNILLIQNAQNAKETFAVSLKNKKNYFETEVKNKASKIAFENSDGWFIGSPAEMTLKKKIETLGKPLKEWDVKIYRGILTGLNEAFIVDQKTRDELVAKNPKSEEIIKPILRGRDIKRYTHEWAGLYLICTFPALHLDIDEFLSVKNFLLDFGKDRLEQSGKDLGNGKKSRKKTGNTWFETQDQIGYYEEFEKEKVVWGNISYNSQFCFVDKGIFVNAPANIITSNNVSIKFLLACMNSSLFNYEFKQGGIFLGKAFEWKKQYVENVHLPIISQNNQNIVSQIESLVDQILALKKQNKDADTKNLEAQIDHLVYQLYDLTPEEIEIVENSGKR
ncbi:MAG: hypothetical protein EOM19_04025 [Candidatus Moranbacteria bacterium]|nr:hypothetical protein [Candidatus Moranbacteria bacterium]